MTLRSIIVDDEKFARENLRMLLESNCPEIEIVGMAGSVSEAKAVIEEVEPKVIFLDIRMPSGTEGFELVDSLPKGEFQVVFVTAFKEYALRAFNANAIHYLLKPIDSHDLKQAVEKLVETNQKFQDDPKNVGEYMGSLENLIQNLKGETPVRRITINHSKGFKIVEDEDIVHLEASGNCTMIYFQNGEKYLDTRTLKVYEEILEPKRFCRIHKSHMINLAYLQEYISAGGHKAILKDGSELPISKGRLQAFVEQIRSI